MNSLKDYSRHIFSPSHFCHFFHPTKLCTTFYRKLYETHRKVYAARQWLIRFVDTTAVISQRNLLNIIAARTLFFCIATLFLFEILIHVILWIISRLGIPKSVTFSRKMAAPDGGYGWVVVFAAFMQHIISLGVAYTLGVYLPYFVAAFNVPASTAAWIAALHLGMMFGSGGRELPFDWLLDVLQTKYCQVLAQFLLELLANSY